MKKVFNDIQLGLHSDLKPLLRPKISIKTLVNALNTHCKLQVLTAIKCHNIRSVFSLKHINQVEERLLNKSQLLLQLYISVDLTKVLNYLERTSVIPRRNFKTKYF